MNKDDYINQFEDDLTPEMILALDLLQEDKWISVAIKKIETGVDNKLVFEGGNWHSYFKIGNQTFYLSESPTKKEAEWQEEQMKTAFNNLLPKPPITNKPKKRAICGRPC